MLTYAQYMYKMLFEVPVGVAQCSKKQLRTSATFSDTHNLLTTFTKATETTSISTTLLNNVSSTFSQIRLYPNPQPINTSPTKHSAHQDSKSPTQRSSQTPQNTQENTQTTNQTNFLILVPRTSTHNK
jgi:hypothetical protein